MAGTLGWPVDGSVADGRRQAGSGIACSRARARLNCSSQGQRRGKCRVNRRAERVSRPARAKNRRRRVLVVTICSPRPSRAVQRARLCAITWAASQAALAAKRPEGRWFSPTPYLRSRGPGVRPPPVRRWPVAQSSSIGHPSGGRRRPRLAPPSHAGSGRRPGRSRAISTSPVVAPGAGVAVVAGALLGIADGRIEVDGEWCVAGSGPSRPGPGQQLAAHPVQLADMAPP